jgi:hypothetical protein
MMQFYALWLISDYFPYDFVRGTVKELKSFIDKTIVCQYLIVCMEASKLKSYKIADRTSVVEL